MDEKTTPSRLNRVQIPRSQDRSRLPDAHCFERAAFRRGTRLRSYHHRLGGSATTAPGV